MRRILLAGALCFLLLSTLALAERGTSSTVVNGKKIEVEYGRPSLQGRDMISRLPVGGTWRMGMNNATTINTEGTLNFGGTKIGPGNYVLTAKKVSEDQWHLVFRTDDGNVEVPLQNKSSSGSVEQFTIDLDSRGNTGMFSMAWGQLSLGTEFTVN